MHSIERRFLIVFCFAVELEFVVFILDLFLELRIDGLFNYGMAFNFQFSGAVFKIAPDSPGE